MKSRIELMNALISKRKFKKYLEIGVDDPNNNFNHIEATTKVGVDPYDDTTGCHAWNGKNRDELIAAIDGTHYEMTSDDYFRSIPASEKFDIVFIDGMHLAEQVEKDFKNAVKHLKRHKGIIVIDDVCPNTEYESKTPPDQGQPWRGSVWRFWASLRAEKQDFMMVVARELGVGVIDFSVKKNGTPKYHNKSFPEYKLSYEFYKHYRTELMNEKPTSVVAELLNL